MKQKNLISLVVALLATAVQAQVTVGSNNHPVDAAVLDIKSQMPDGRNVTSNSGGVVLPRIKLQNISTLQPIIEPTAQNYAALKQQHIGLVVYNLNRTIGEGFYVWTGERWQLAVAEDNSAPTATVYAKNGLKLNGLNIELGGTLNSSTSVDFDEKTLNFATGSGYFSVNENDFAVKNHNTGIGKSNPTEKLDVEGSAKITGDLSVKKSVLLKNTEITGNLEYNSHNKNKNKGKYLRVINTDGLASWQNLGGLTGNGMDSFPTKTGGGAYKIFDPNVETDYVNTGLSEHLPHGEWLINYSIRLVSSGLNSGNTANAVPTLMRVTLLDENENPIPQTAATKPYDEGRIYPDIQYNSITGFFVVSNSDYVDKKYFLGIKKSPDDTNVWAVYNANGNNNIEISNTNSKDAYILPLLLSEDW